jgi:dynein heavy chain 1, cytosolic
VNCVQGAMKPDEAMKVLAVFEGKLARLKEERDNIAKAKEALELAEPGFLIYLVIQA